VFNWKAGSVGFFLGLGGLGLFLWLLMSLDKGTPFWLMFSASFAPAAVYCIATLENWPNDWSDYGERFALRFFLCVALTSAVVGAVHGLTADYVFPGVLAMIGAWPCVLGELAIRPKPFKQVRYRHPPSEADGSVVIKSSIAKLTWLVILVGLLLSMSISAIPSAAGWVGSLLLGPLLILAIYIYRPSANYLRIDRTGVEVVIGGRRSKSNWNDIIGFHVGDQDGDKMVGILYSDAYLNLHSCAPKQSGDGWIRNVFVLEPEVLCAILNEWRTTIAADGPAKLH
jgi:hypothetical protein